MANPKGLCEVSQVSGSMDLVCPGLQKGQVRVEHYASKRTKFIMAHDSRIVCFVLKNNGRLLTTSSSKGTLVRVFNTLDGSRVQEELKRREDAMARAGVVIEEHYNKISIFNSLVSTNKKFVFHSSWSSAFETVKTSLLGKLSCCQNKY